MLDSGKRFEKTLKKSMEAGGFWAYRIKDNTYKVGNQVLSKKTPADFLFIGSGIGDSKQSSESFSDGLHSYLVEAKATASHRLSFAKVTENQNESLKKFDDIHRDAHGVVAVNFYDELNIRAKNRCFLISYSVWDEYQNGAAASISEEECEMDKRITECPLVKGGLFHIPHY